MTLSLDHVAFGLFVVMWFGYNYLADSSPLRRHTLGAKMDLERRVWMRRGGQAEERISSTAVLQVMMSGMSIFASSAIFVIGGLVAGIAYAPEISAAFKRVPFIPAATPELLMIKMGVLLAMFVYIFFKLGWAIRLAHYTAIMVATLGGEGETRTREDDARSEAAAVLANRTGFHFNRALRGYFLALALVGWFFGAAVFIAATIFAMFTIARREFYSEAHRVLCMIYDKSDA